MVTSPEYIKYYLRRSKMAAFLEELENTAGNNAVTVYLPPGLENTEINGLLEKAGISEPASEEISREAAASAGGSAIFWCRERRCLVRPPFPLEEKVILAGCDAGPLRRLLDRDWLTGLVLVHLGSYAVGICRGETLLDGKVGTGLVHGRHKKGGSSQGRFQRRRQNQADEFLDRVCRHAREKLEPRVKELEYIAYGGPRQTVMSLQKRCPFLTSLKARALPPLEVPEIRQKVLETAVIRVWSSIIIEWPEAALAPGRLP